MSDFSLLGNLLWTKSLVHNYIEQANEAMAAKGKHPLPALFSASEISLCMKKILDSPINIENLRLFFEGCIAASSQCNLKNSFSEDLGYILVANVLRNLFSLQNDFIPTRQRDIANAQFNIQRLFTENPDLKASEFFQSGHQEVLKEIYSGIDLLEQDPSQPDAVVNKNQSLRICFSAGRLQSSDPTFLHRYENALTPAQKEIFKNCGLFTEESDLCMLRCCYHGNDVFIKKLPDGSIFTLRKVPGYPQEIPHMKIQLPDGSHTWGQWLSEETAFSYLNNKGICCTHKCFAIKAYSKNKKSMTINTDTKTLVLGVDIPYTDMVVCDKKKA